MGSWRKGWTLVVHALNVFKIHPAFQVVSVGVVPKLDAFPGSPVVLRTPNGMCERCLVRFTIGAPQLGQSGVVAATAPVPRFICK